MAVEAIDGGVGFFKGEDGGVVEVGHLVYAIVATQTGVAKQGDVFVYEQAVDVGVTGDAVEFFDGKTAVYMTILASDGRTIDVALVFRQTEPHIVGMIEIIDGEGGDVGIGSFVIGVAALTIFALEKTAVQPCFCLSFLGDGEVAIFAPFGGDAVP